MTTAQPSLLDRDAAGYRQQLEEALSAQLRIVTGHAAGRPEPTPWEFDAALASVRVIATELRWLTLGLEPVPF